MNDMIDQLAAHGPWQPTTLVLVLAVLAFAVGTVHRRFLVLASIACYAVLLLNSQVIAIPGVVDLRLVGLATVIYLAMLRGRLPRLTMLRRGIFPATLVYMFFGLVLLPVAQDTGLAGGGLFGTLITVVFAWTLLTAADDDEIRSGIRLSAGVMVVGSVVWVLVDPGVAIAGGRWRGITANANALGLFAGLFFLTGKSKRSYWSLAPVLAVLAGSASRASTFALGLVAGPELLRGQSKMVRRTMGALAVLVAIPILHSVFFSSADAVGRQSKDQGLTRTANSRGDEWAEAVDLIEAHPFTGVGVGSQPDKVSSSVLSPLVEIGIWAVIPLFMIALVAVSLFNSKHRWSRALFLFLMVNGLFEMWLFAGGSIFFMVFLVAGASGVMSKESTEEETVVAGGADSLRSIGRSLVGNSRDT